MMVIRTMRILLLLLCMLLLSNSAFAQGIALSGLCGRSCGPPSFSFFVWIFGWFFGLGFLAASVIKIVRVRRITKALRLCETPDETTIFRKQRKLALIFGAVGVFLIASPFLHQFVLVPLMNGFYPPSATSPVKTIDLREGLLR